MLRPFGLFASSFVAAVLLVAAPASAKPGDLLTMQPVRAPAGALGWRISYLSTGLDGRERPVTGLIYTPKGPAPPGGRPVVAWAHPTTGVAESCAPSLHLTGFGLVPHLSTLIADGYVVASTDYPGLGTVGPHPYIVGVSEARAVLDAVRVAAKLPGTGANGHFVVWGHSQGGHASLYTGIIAAQYAPELTLEGVAAVAPATDLVALMKDDISERGGRILASYAVWSWTRVYGLPIQSVVKKNAIWIVNRVARECVQSTFEAIAVVVNSALLRQTFVDSSVYTDPAWRAEFVANTPGAMPASIPLFIAQGRDDVTVRPAITRAYARAACARGQRVDYDSIPGGHLGAAEVSADAAIAWISRRFAHAAVASTCGALSENTT